MPNGQRLYLLVAIAALGLTFVASRGDVIAPTLLHSASAQSAGSSSPAPQAVAPAVPAPKSTAAVPESREAIRLSFAPVVKRVAPAVVNVYATSKVQVRSPFEGDPFFERFFGRNGPFGGHPAPRERARSSLGSGVIVDASGLVVTNHHVISEATEVKVALADGREFPADILLRDERTDLAVLKLEGSETPFPVLPFADSDELEVGDLVLAVGNPFAVGQTVTSGIVSAVSRTNIGINDSGFFIQTDAAINPGNSGGALVDMAGRLVGINTAIFSRTGGSVGIGFAIPATMVRAVVDSARSGNRTVRRPWLGARLQTVTQEIAQGLGLDRASGVLVAALAERGPADQAGLRRGDVIVAVDGQDVDDAEAFGYRFALKGLDGQAAVAVMRGGKREIVQVRLQPPTETRPRDPVRIRGRSPFTGATAVNLSPAVADELQLDAATADGVAVAEVEEGSLAARVGFQRGDVIVAVNGARINQARDLEQATRGASGIWEITLNRGGRVFTSLFRG